MNRPNILWYCTDQQRFDTINALGNQEVNTPNLDRLVHDGTAFTRAYTQCPICTPSRASFLTGKYPASHHVQRNGNERFPDGEKLATKLFAEAGYDCGLVGKLHIAGAQRTREERADDGYRFYQWSHHPYPDIEGNTFIDWLRDEKGEDIDTLFEAIDGSYGVGLPEELHQTTFCSEKAIEFISEEREGPWLLSVNPFSPHPTFHPPREYLDKYDVESIAYPPFRESDVETQRTLSGLDQQTVEAIDARKPPEERRAKVLDLPKDQLASIPPTDYDARLLRACYYAEIELVDKQFGRILDALARTGQLENTIVIFMSDHGELLGDHGLLFKGCRFFESLVHVPLVISWQGRWNRNIQSPALVELIDIAPTLLEAAGMDVPYYMQGKSLLPILDGSGDPHSHKPYVFSEYNDAMSAGTTANEYEGSHGTMYYDGRYKMAVYRGHETGEIYDHQEDPGEFDNLWDSAEHQDLKLRLLKEHLDAMMGTVSAGIRRTKDY